MAAIIPAVAATLASGLGSALDRKFSTPRTVNVKLPGVGTRSSRRRSNRRARGITMNIQGPATRRQARKGRRPRRSVGGFKKRGGGITLSHPFYTGIPSSVGSVSGPSQFAISGMNGPASDFDKRDSITCHGTMELSRGVKTGSDYSEDTKNGGFSVGSAGAAIQVRPADLAASSAAKIYPLAQIFSHYRFRMLRLKYVPQQASTNTAMVYFAYDPDPDASGITSATTGFTPAFLREYSANAVTSSYQPAEFVYTNDGARCFTNDASDSTDEGCQGLFLCVVRGGATSTTYGRFELEYVIDFFGLRPSYGTPSPLVHGAIKKENDCKPSQSVENELKTRYTSVSNDDVKSLFEEKLIETGERTVFPGLVERPLLKRSDPIPIPRPLKNDSPEQEKKRK